MENFPESHCIHIRSTIHAGLEPLSRQGVPLPVATQSLAVALLGQAASDDPDRFLGEELGGILPGLILLDSQ